MNDRGVVREDRHHQISRKDRQMSGPALYQHRPTVVRAIQFTPHNRPEVEDWLAVNWPVQYQFSIDGTHLLIETPEGDRDCSAEDGYWLVEGVAHELYCVRPDVFARLYDPAGVAICGAPAEACRCEQPEGHPREVPHLCECGGSWRGTFPDDFEVVEWPAHLLPAPGGE